MRRNLRALYAVLFVVVLCAPVATASPPQEVPTDGREWTLCGWLNDLVTVVLGHCTDGAEGASAGPTEEGLEGDPAGSAEETTTDGGPDIDPAG